MYSSFDGVLPSALANRTVTADEFRLQTFTLTKASFPEPTV